MRNKDIGIFFVVLGIGWLAANYFGVTERILENFWVMIFWVFGLAFEIACFSKPKRNVGLLVPGGLFLTLGFIFSFCTLFGYDWMEILWPLFILAPAVGLFQLYLFGERNNALLIPVAILGSISGFFLFMNIGGMILLDKVFPTMLIIIGIIILLFSNKKGKTDEKEEN